MGYKFAPVMRSEFRGMQVASGTTCPITRLGISGSGGRRDVLSEQAKNLIMKDKFSQQVLRLRALEIGLGELRDDQ